MGVIPSYRPFWPRRGHYGASDGDFSRRSPSGPPWPSPEQPGQCPSGKLDVVDVHIELVRVFEDGLEQGAVHLDATAGLKIIALVWLEVGLQVDRDTPGGQEVDVARPQPRCGLDWLRNALDLDLVADRALVSVEGELGRAPAVTVARDFPGNRIHSVEGCSDFDLGIGPRGDGRQQQHHQHKAG